jgi:hypothetical protein
MKPKIHKSLPIVLIESVDHCMDTPNNLNENNMRFHVVGILFAETKRAWYVCTWLMGGDYRDHNNEGFMILKIPGSKLKVLGHLNEK